jgi:hypothetical protein
MMVGGVAYLYPLNLKGNRKINFEWLGLVLILGSYLFISKENPWPGFLAVFPVLGSFFVIQANRKGSFITGNIVFQKLGAWSYSLYLWHWPVVVSISYFTLHEVYIYLGIVLSIWLGFLSNKYIEKMKFRNDFCNFTSYLKCKPIQMVFLVGIIGTIVHFAEGFPNRLTEYQLKISSFNYDLHKQLNDEEKELVKGCDLRILSKSIPCSRLKNSNIKS